MDILLVEDESEIATSIQSRLQEEGMSVSWVSDYEIAKRLFSSPENLPRVLILDRLVGAFDLLDSIPEIRKKNSTAGIIVLSTINSPLEKADALEKGADDYLGKPFSMTELIARIRALDRRSTRGGQRSLYEFADIQLNVMTRNVIVKGERLTLTTKEFLILKLLVTNPGRIYSKSHIYEAVWDISSNFETNVIEATINSLRRKLEDTASATRIRNTRQVGYWIEN